MTKKQKEKSFKEYLQEIEDPKNNSEVNYALPENPTPLQVAKFRLCKKILGYKLDNNLTREQVAEKIGISKAETEDILFCHIEEFTLDRLVEYAKIIKQEKFFDLIIIDGPARTSQGTLEIAKQADLIIQPTGASLADLKPSVNEFHSLVKAGINKKKLVFVLNHLATKSEESAAREYLTLAGYSVFTHSLKEKASYRLIQNEGKSISEVSYKSLQKEAKELVIGEKVDKRTLRRTGRTEQFATRVSKEWLEKVKGIAEKENLKLVEVLEKSLECYERHRNGINKAVSVNIERQNPKRNFSIKMSDNRSFGTAWEENQLAVSQQGTPYQKISII
ncbi:9198_t:CDS:2, partial [Cetraspora pellucida]